MSLVENIFKDYEKAKYVLETHLSSRIRQDRVVGSLFTFTSSGQFLLNLLLKRHRITTISYQHGSYYFRNKLIKYCEIIPAQKCFVFGKQDATFFKELCPDSHPIVKGSPTYLKHSKLKSKNNKKVVYFLASQKGNHWQSVILENQYLNICTC